MRRFGVYPLLLLSLLAAAARPNDAGRLPAAVPRPPASVTDEWLAGEWTGAFPNATIVVRFAPADGRKVAVVELAVGCEVLTGRFGYTIDGPRNEVRFPAAAGATAVPTADGALLLSGTFALGGDAYALKAKQVERAKRGDKAGGGKAPPDAAARFYGSWLTVEKVVAGGPPVTDPDRLSGTTFAPEGYWVWPRRGGEMPGGPVGRVRVDAAADPMRVDLVVEPQGDRPRHVLPGVFRFDGDRLVVAWGGWEDERPLEPGEDYARRPTGFRSTRQNGVTVEILRPCQSGDQD